MRLENKKDVLLFPSAKSRMSLSLGKLKLRLMSQLYSSAALVQSGNVTNGDLSQVNPEQEIRIGLQDVIDVTGAGVAWVKSANRGARSVSLLLGGEHEQMPVD